jgi:hypothetical protein
MVTLALRLLSVEKPASVDDLVAAIDTYLRETTKKPEPLVWTGSVETILKKIARCEARFETLGYPLALGSRPALTRREV